MYFTNLKVLIIAAFLVGITLALPVPSKFNAPSDELLELFPRVPEQNTPTTTPRRRASSGSAETLPQPRLETVLESQAKTQPKRRTSVSDVKMWQHDPPSQQKGPATVPMPPGSVLPHPSSELPPAPMTFKQQQQQQQNSVSQLRRPTPFSTNPPDPIRPSFKATLPPRLQRLQVRPSRRLQPPQLPPRLQLQSPMRLQPPQQPPGRRDWQLPPRLRQGPASQRGYY